MPALNMLLPAYLVLAIERCIRKECGRSSLNIAKGVIIRETERSSDAGSQDAASSILGLGQQLLLVGVWGEALPQAKGLVGAGGNLELKLKGG